MAMKTFTLTKKIELTRDVFELHFTCNEGFIIKPWQFITFILPKIGWRAYSVLEQNNHNTALIIKRVERENWWRWWSIHICDTNIWETLNWVWPAGHFILKDNTLSKLFIWTGTGLVPLYNQIVSGLERWDAQQYTLLFWVRTTQDIFYQKKYKKLSEKYPNFHFQIYLSREESNSTIHGYVTDFLHFENITQFHEFYICGAPNMVDSSVEKIKEHWWIEENIFTEKY